MCEPCKQAILSDTTSWGAYNINPGSTPYRTPSTEGRNLWTLMKKSKRSVPSLFLLCKDVISRTELGDEIVDDYITGEYLYLKESSCIKKDKHSRYSKHGPFHSSVTDPDGTLIFPIAIPDFDFVCYANTYYYRKFPHLFPGTEKPPPYTPVPGTNLYRANKHMKATFDLYWLITDILGFEFTDTHVYNNFWQSVHWSQCDSLAWQSGRFAILDIAPHLWNKNVTGKEDESVDPRTPILYTNNLGFYQQCKLSFDFLKFLEAHDEELYKRFHTEGVKMEKLARSNDALFSTDPDNITNVETLDSGDVWYFDGDYTLRTAQTLMHSKLRRASDEQTCISMTCRKYVESEYDDVQDKHKTVYQITFLKLFEFYPRSLQVYSYKSVMIIEHFQNDEKMGEVYLSKSMLEKLLEFHDNTLFLEEGLSGREKHANVHQHPWLIDSPPLEQIFTLDHNCRSCSINSKHSGTHSVFDHPDSDTDSDITEPLFSDDDWRVQDIWFD